jgi:hypothetical protein
LFGIPTEERERELKTEEKCSAKASTIHLSGVIIHIFTDLFW